VSVTDSGNGAIRSGGSSDLTLPSVFPIIIGDRALFRTDVQRRPMSHLGTTDERIVWFAAWPTTPDYWPESSSPMVDTNFTTPQEGVEDIFSDSSSYQPYLKTVVQQRSSAFPMSKHLDLTRVSNWRDDHTYLKVNVNGITVLRRKGIYANINS
jgi:hypothetical protein